MKKGKKNEKETDKHCLAVTTVTTLFQGPKKKSSWSEGFVRLGSYFFFFR